MDILIVIGTAIGLAITIIIVFLLLFLITESDYILPIIFVGCVIATIFIIAHEIAVHFGWIAPFINL